MRTLVSLAFLAVFISGADYIGWATPAVAPVQAVQPQPVPTTSGGGTSYSLADVANHSSRSDCWTTINDNVYNVTSWIDQHPGGAEAIISLCGIDGSDAYNGQHGGERRPANELATFLIGTLAGAPSSAADVPSARSTQTQSIPATPVRVRDDD